MTTERAAWLVLAAAATTGTQNWFEAARTAGGALSLFAASAAEQQAAGLSPNNQRRLRSGGGIEQGQRLLRQASSLGLQLCVPFEPSYPGRLLDIPDPPLVLYYRGLAPTALGPVVALVGTREPSDYGRRMATSLAEALAERGVCVASGLARGIDECAHQGALRKGITVAVLPSGLDRIYPASNSRLARAIASRGALLGERLPGSRPAPWDFPRRNRIVTGLAAVTVVIAARRASGTWTSAMHALAQGRPLLALPGNIDEPTSEAPNALIEQGCPPLLTLDDVLERLEGMDTRATVPGPVPASPLSGCNNSGKLGGDEARVLAALETSAMGVENLVEAVALDGARIMALLTSLELAGLVEKGHHGRYRAASSGGSNPWTSRPPPPQKKGPGGN